jgi:hypothetical protein
MRVIRQLFLWLALLVVAFIAAAIVADVYRRLRYPDVPRHEADVFFDIGLVFLVGFVAVAGALGGCLLLLRGCKAVPGDDA